MQLSDFKKQVLDNSLENLNLVFKYTDNQFLVNTYIDTICKNKDLERIDISSFDEINQDDFSLFMDDNALYVISLDKLSIVPEYTNCIVLCKEVESSVKDKINLIEFPKLQNWQIEDYAQTKAPGLSKDKIKWLCEIAKYDIYRVNNEIDKLAIFTTSNQEDIFAEIDKENGYEDLNNFTIFNLINAITKRNKQDVLNILKVIEQIDVEPVGLVTLLIRQFKGILSIQFNPRITYTDLGVTQKQYMAWKYNCGKYTNKELVSIYELLLSIDYRLKNGLIENNQIVDYIICNIL